MTTLLAIFLLATSNPIPGRARNLDLVPGSEHVITGQITFTSEHAFVIKTENDLLALYLNGQTSVKQGDMAIVTCLFNRRLLGEPTRVIQSATIIGHQNVDPPLETTIEQIIARKLYLRNVRIRGTIEDLIADEIDPRFFIATIRSQSEAALLSIERNRLSDFASPGQLLRAEVEIVGICIQRYPSHRFLSGPSLVLQDNSCIRIVKQASEDIFAKPAFDASIVTLPSEFSALGLKTLTGRVVARWSANNILLQSGENNIVSYHCIELSPDCKQPAVGSTIKIVGQPETDLFHVNFSRAIYKNLPEQESEVLPQDEIGLNDAIGDGYYLPNAFGHLITAQGTVIAGPRAESGDTRLHLSASGKEVTVDFCECPDKLIQCPVGSDLMVKGVCLLESDNWKPNTPLPKIKGLTILARSEKDITVLSRPSWWTNERLLILVIGLLALLTAIVVWNQSLKRLIVRRSRELLREQTAHLASELRVGERTRLAVELHDTLSQNLSGVACQVTSAQTAIGQNDESARQRLSIAEKMLKSCRTELRYVLSDLRSEALEEHDLSNAIRIILDGIADDIDVSIRFNVPRARLLDTTTHAILSIIRELVSNAVRHGHATRVRIAGAIDPGKLTFSVTENGNGFNPSVCAGPLEGHFGLDGIRNRVTRLLGTVKIISAPQKGSRTVVTLPTGGNAHQKA